jgi:RNA polymerase sigma-70 factor (ECF subfamily)
MTPNDNLPQGGSRGTLGEVLFAKPSQVLVPEKDWLGLVQSVAAGDQLALHALYERTYRVVFTLLMRMTSNRAIAEELTLDVYHDVWQRASRFDGSSGSVLGWIMNQARFKAVDRVRFDQRKKQAGPELNAGLLPIDAPDYRDLLQVKEQGRMLRAALAVLSAEEREVIEAAYFSELTLAGVASRSSQSIAAIKARMHSALHKLREALPKAAMKDTNTPKLANHCDQAELVCAHALHALPREDIPALEAHLASCWQCRRELDSMRPVLDCFLVWPTDVLRPPASLQERLALRIAAHTDGKPVLPPLRRRPAPQWEDVAPGISCKLLATDAQRHMVSMLVRLVPGGTYPSHTHAGAEELHLLDGELWIDERKLHPGDYYGAEPGSGDGRVWSETGCTCVLITSTKDVLTAR